MHAEKKCRLVEGSEQVCRTMARGAVHVHIHVLEIGSEDRGRVSADGKSYRAVAGQAWPEMEGRAEDDRVMSTTTILQ